MPTTQEYVVTFSPATMPPPALPRSMVWLLVGSLIALATLPWAIPYLIVRMITP